MQRLAFVGVFLAGFALAAVLIGSSQRPVMLIGGQQAGSLAPKNCAEARAMGLENIPRGSPYYGPWLDRDNDGLACEPWNGHRRH